MSLIFICQKVATGKLKFETRFFSAEGVRVESYSGPYSFQIEVQNNSEYGHFLHSGY